MTECFWIAKLKGRLDDIHRIIFELEICDLLNRQSGYDPASLRVVLSAIGGSIFHWLDPGARLGDKLSHDFDPLVHYLDICVQFLGVESIGEHRVEVGQRVP